MVDLAVLGLWLDLRILKVFFNLNDSKILCLSGGVLHIVMEQSRDGKTW